MNEGDGKVVASPLADAAVAWARGHVIAVCGIDGSGKSTLIDRVADELSRRGHKVFCTRQPTTFYRELEPVRRFHDEGDKAVPVECMALLSAADRALHLTHEVIPALLSSSLVISDRFLPAAEAIFAARGLDDEWVSQINAFCPPPHGQILLDLPGAVAVRRIRQRGGSIRLEERSSTTLEAIRQAYLQRRRPNCMVLDATMSPDALAKEAVAYIATLSSVSPPEGTS
jgi:dTMP kinase